MTRADVTRIYLAHRRLSADDAATAVCWIFMGAAVLIFGGGLLAAALKGRL